MTIHAHRSSWRFATGKLLICLLTLMPMISAAAAESGWREYRSAHFIVRSDAKPKAARLLVRDLEWYRHVVGRITNIDFSNDETPPLRIWAWKTTREYIRATKAYGTGGFYNMGLDGPYAMMSIEPAERPLELDGRQVILHEYTHHIIHQFSPIQYPRWYDEGMAEFLSTMKFKDKGLVVIGGPIGRAAVLRDFDWVPFRDLMESKGQYMRQHRVSMRDPRRARPAISLQYAEGWITAHYLMTHPERRKQIQTYLSLMNRPDVRDEDAFKQAFLTDYKGLQKDVRKYFWSMKLPTLGMRITDLPKVKIKERKLSDEESGFQNIEGMLVAGDYSDSGKDNRDRIIALYEAGVRPKDMAYYLARIAIAEEDDDDDAKAHAKEADKWIAAYSKAGGSPAIAAYLKGLRELTAIFGDKAGFAKATQPKDPERLAVLRRQLKQGMRADPTDPRPHYLYALSFAFTDERPDRQAMASIGIVRDRLPDFPRGAIVEAILRAHNGDRQGALDQLNVLARWAFSAGARNRYQKIAKRIEEMPESASAGKSASKG